MFCFEYIICFICFACILGLQIVTNYILLICLKILIGQNLAKMKIMFSNYFESKIIDVSISRSNFPDFTAKK